MPSRRARSTVAWDDRVCIGICCLLDSAHFPRLELANRAFKLGEIKSLSLTELVYNELLVHEGVEVDYCDVVSVRGFEEKEHADDSCVLACAAFVDGVRLIDHVLLGSPAIPVALED